MADQPNLYELYDTIGGLRTSIENLKSAHNQKASEDREFRQAGYRAFGRLEQIAETQKEHESRLENHDKRLDSHDRSRSWAKGVMATIGVVGGLIGTALGYVVQYVSPGQGH